MLVETLFFIRRCTPAVVFDRVHDRLQRTGVTLIALFSKLPFAQSLLSRHFLTSYTYLLDFEQNRPLGFAQMEPEDTPAAELFQASRFPGVYRETSKLIAGDLYGLAGYPAVQPRKLAEGGLVLSGRPEPSFVYVPPGRFHCTLHEGYLNIKSGGVCTRDGVMVIDHAPVNRRRSSLKSMQLFGGRRPNHAQRQAGLCMSLAGSWSASNYFHWLIDGVAGVGRMAEIAGERPVTVLVSQDVPPQWMSALELCLPEGFTVCHAKGWVQMEQFLFLSPDRLNSFAWLTRQEIDYCRTAILNRFGLDPNTLGTRRIYISRDRTLKRRLVNEAEIDNVLAEFAFEKIRLEELSFEQQVKIFKGAGFIAGVHGAGFANLLFSGPARVMEFFPAGMFKPLYFGLAASLGQTYHFVYGGKPSPLMDFYLDPGKLEDSIHKMLQQ